MGAFAGLLKAAGHEVEGSDSGVYPPMDAKLQEWGIPVKTPYQAANLSMDLDWVVVGNAISQSHPEVQALQSLGLAYASFPQTLSNLFLQDRQSIVATGTHGKTTISALLAHTLVHAGFDPSFLIGGIPKNFNESFRLGQGAHFVVEGDEYDTAYFDKGPKFLHYRPKYLLCSSLEHDHADIYANVDQIVERFAQVLSLVPEEGVVVLNTLYPELQRALEKATLKAKLIPYAEPQDCWENEEGLRFTVDGQAIRIPLSGRHNAQNALGCYRILQAVGLSHDQIRDGFEAFQGVKRRMEVVGQFGGVTVIDDFAHHPTAVQLTLEGARKRFKNQSIWALFEPRSASSCRRVFQDAYAQSFDSADRVLLAPPGRSLEPELSLDVAKLATQIGSKAEAFDSVDALIRAVREGVLPNTVLLCMSNGPFEGIHQRLLETIQSKF